MVDHEQNCNSCGTGSCGQWEDNHSSCSCTVRPYAERVGEPYSVVSFVLQVWHLYSQGAAVHVTVNNSLCWPQASVENPALWYTWSHQLFLFTCRTLTHRSHTGPTSAGGSHCCSRMQTLSAGSVYSVQFDLLISDREICYPKAFLTSVGCEGHRGQSCRSVSVAALWHYLVFRWFSQLFNLVGKHEHSRWII